MSEGRESTIFVTNSKNLCLLVSSSFSYSFPPFLQFQKGHVRVGPDTVTDPAFLVTKSMEDFVTWVDTSKIRRKVRTYNDQLDDFEFMDS